MSNIPGLHLFCHIYNLLSSHHGPPHPYPDVLQRAHVQACIAMLLSLWGPPLQIDCLHDLLVQVQRNNAFPIYAGNCVESFDTCTSKHISAKISLSPSSSSGTLPHRPHHGAVLKAKKLPLWANWRLSSFVLRCVFCPSSRTHSYVQKKRQHCEFNPNDRTPDPKCLPRSVPHCLSKSLVSSLIGHSAYFHSTWAAMASLWTWIHSRLLIYCHCCHAATILA